MPGPLVEEKGEVEHSALNGPESVTGAASTGKACQILQACQSHDLDELVHLADSAGGLLTDSLRGKAWPLLLGCEREPDNYKGANQSWKQLPRHRDEDQVQLDVNRAFVHYPSNEPEKAMTARRAALSDLIVQTLRQHPMLCYFQGYHDIVQVLLLVLDPPQASVAVSRISLLRIRDYMLPKLEPALVQLRLLPAILRASDPSLAAHLSQIQPHFALAATLTLYAHDTQDYGDISRLFDFILAHEPVMSLYLFASLVLSRRTELLEVPAEDADMLHFTLTQLPQRSFDLELLIPRALDLFKNHPPRTLPGFVWWRISSFSALKTFQSLKITQTAHDGETFFKKQAQEMKRQELQQRALIYISKNRMAIAKIATAVLVGALSVWLRRNGQDIILWGHLWRALSDIGPGR